MRVRVVVATLVIVVLAGGMSPVRAHRSGCHRWHSCPSDHATDACGDLGYCSACPDNAFRKLGKPRQTPPKPEKAASKKPEA